MLNPSYDRRNNSEPIFAPSDSVALAESAPAADWSECPRPDHFVQFYESDDYLAATVAEYAKAGLDAGESFIAAATQQHIGDLERAMTAAGIDLGSARHSGRFVTAEAEETLSKFMVDGMPDPDFFAAWISGLIEDGLRHGRRVRIFGELVALLISDKNPDACVRLEQLWNEMRSKYSFSLFCAYPTGAFPNRELAETLTRVCDEHSRIIPDETYTLLPTPAERLKNIAFLQQRSKQLEAEIAELQMRVSARNGA